MKNIVSIITIVLGLAAASAQVGVETATVRPDGIMDFPSPATKGILLPLVESSGVTPSAGGAMVFDLTDQRVEFYNPSTGAWEPMTAASTNLIEGPEHINPDRYDDLNPENGTVIEAGTVTQTPPVGVLVLESDDKALILPQVEDATQLPGPKAGMICYDMASDSIAVFNGTEWSFWN